MVKKKTKNCFQDDITDITYLFVWLNDELKDNNYNNNDSLLLALIKHTIEDLVNLDNNVSALIKFWKVYYLLPDNGIDDGIKKLLYETLYKVVSLPDTFGAKEPNISQLIRSSEANMIFLGIIKKSELFKLEYNLNFNKIYNFADKLDDFLEKFNKYLKLADFILPKFNDPLQFILVIPHSDIKKYYDPWTEPFNIKDNDETLAFSHVIHVTHLKNFKSMCKKGTQSNSLNIEFEGNFNYYFKGLKLIWFSVFKDEKNRDESWYGNIGIKIPFETLLSKYPYLYSLGTRKFKQEHEHVIIMSKTKQAISNLNEMRQYPTISLESNPILGKNDDEKDDRKFIWKNITDNSDRWDNLTFCIIESEFNYTANINDLVCYSHKIESTICVPSIQNHNMWCIKISKDDANKQAEEFLGTLQIVP